MKTLEKIPFEGTEIVCLNAENTYYVSAKIVIEAVGLNYDTSIDQLNRHPILGQSLISQKIKPEIIENLTCHKASQFVENEGYEMTFIPLDKLSFWLCQINANKVNDEAREKLLAFQLKCADVLYVHFFGGKLPIKSKESVQRDERIKEIYNELRTLGKSIFEAEQNLKKAPEKQELQDLRKRKRDLEGEKTRLLSEQYSNQIALFQ
jgi:hypothetical protein